MGTFQRKTLRNFTPLAREIAEAINETDAVKRRLLRLLEHIMTTELEAQALRNRFPTEAKAISERAADQLRLPRNKGRYTLSELDKPFHDPAPLQRSVLGE